MKTENIISELETRIAADCKTVDREGFFNDMLDECYSFANVGGPFAHMSPSRVLLECDPVAHRCGVDDYADGQDWVEVRGETYQQSDVDEIKDALLDELNAELGGAQGELDALNDEESSDKGEIFAAEKSVAEIESQIAELEKHSF